MAVVYRAKVRGPEGFEKTVAVKRIRSELSDKDEFRDMFVQEARVAGRLSHGNIVQVFDFGQAGDTYFIALELVEGMDLKKLTVKAFEQEKALPPAFSAWICQKVAVA